MYQLIINLQNPLHGHLHFGLVLQILRKEEMIILLIHHTIIIQTDHALSSSPDPHQGEVNQILAPTAPAPRNNQLHVLYLLINLLPKYRDLIVIPTFQRLFILPLDLVLLRQDLEELVMEELLHRLKLPRVLDDFHTHQTPQKGTDRR